MDITNEFLALVPIVLGVTQVAKMTGLSRRYMPLVSLILGVIGAVSLGAFDATGVMQGVVVGLSASGLWSGGKAVLDK